MTVLCADSKASESLFITDVDSCMMDVFLIEDIAVLVASRACTAALNSSTVSLLTGCVIRVSLF